MTPISLPYERIDKFLARRLGQLDTKIDTLVRGGVNKDTALSVTKAQLVGLVTTNAFFLGIKPGSSEYEYAVAKASDIASGMVDWAYDPEHVTPLVVAKSFEESRRLGVASKSISIKIGMELGMRAEAVGKGARRVGEWARRIGEYI